MSPTFSQWTFEADIYRRIPESEDWEWYASIRDVASGEDWITRRDNPEDWKVEPKIAISVPEETDEDSA